MVINIFYFTILSSAGGTSLETLQGLMGHPFFWLRIIIEFIVPLIILSWGISKGKKISLAASGSVFILVLLGELLGRTMFYDTVVALHMVNS